MSWTLLGLRSEHSYSQAATKLQSVNKPGLEGLGYPWQHCSPPGRFPAAFKVFIVDSWLVTECDCWKGSSTAPSLPLQQVGAAPSLASPVGLHTPHLNWDQNPIAVITLLLSPCCYQLAFSVPCAQAWAKLSGEPLQMPSLEARTVTKGAGTQPQGFPAFSITLQDVTSDPIERRCSQESWLGLTLRKRQKFPVLPLLFCSCFFFHSCSLLVFIKKDPCIINIVHPSTVTIKQTPYFHTTHDLQGYR